MNQSSYNSVNFEVKRMKSAQCLWVFPAATETEGEFIEKYAVGIATNTCFENVAFYKDIHVKVIAERYGGSGGGVNGGGVRCANIHDAQVKGIGTNCLVGSNVPKWHSHGAQNITEAVCEVIYADVLQKIMPIGTVSCRGIILTGDNAAFFTDDIAAEEFATCWGALLVRDTCVRPAHFLRTRAYIPPKEHSYKMPSDVARVRAIHKALASEHANHNEFIRSLGKFLANCANQFAFAQVARIAHMATSPSNIAMDGKWLDLASVSFLDGGKNYAVDPKQRSFLKEYTLIEETVFELVATYAKFNEVALNAAPLLNYFREAMSNYFHEHCSFLFGFANELWPKMGELKECDALVKMVHQLIHDNETVVVGLPLVANPADPIILFVQCLFVSLADQEKAHKLFVEHFNDKFSAAEVFRCFSCVVDSVWGKQHNVLLNKKAFLISAALTALKKSLCSAFYYRGRVKGQLDEMLFRATIPEFKAVLDDSISVASWVFNTKENGQVNLFTSSSIVLGYSALEQFFYIEHMDKKEKFKKIDDFLIAINFLEDGKLVIQGYSFLTYLNTLHDVISTLEEGLVINTNSAELIANIPLSCSLAEGH